MMLNLLAEANDPFRSANVGEASLYALLGFSIVFLGIAFLIFVVWAVGKGMTAFEKKAAESKKKPEPVQETPKVSNTEEELSDEVVAVITAAIAAYYQKENKKCDFTVKRIKRI